MVFRVRRIYDTTLPVNVAAIAEVQTILREQFSDLSEDEINSLPQKLHDPLKYGFRSTLLVAEDGRMHVKGFALLMYAPDLEFCLLDYLSVARAGTSRGIGSALYQRVREEARSLNSMGLFFECLPDEARLSRDPAIRRQNRARLRFYERHGARPIINTAYETPLNPGDDNPPFLVYDDLGRKGILRKVGARRIVRAILERKYGDLCPIEYIEKVVASFMDDPVQRRAPRYERTEPEIAIDKPLPQDKRIGLVVNDRHDIHHIRERGYVEAPIRIASLLRGLENTQLFKSLPVRHYSERNILAVHDPGYIRYFKRACSNLPPGKSIYPYVFPLRNRARPPKELSIRAGYYCIDTFTPLNGNAFLAARRAVDCTLTGAHALLRGDPLVYVLVRPPGHHAETKAFGGFCYFNNCAVAAQLLSRTGRVAILDIDYHHGNGQQQIFYRRADVLTLSIHGHPRFAYPYFSGFEDEKGEDEGYGFNVNLPLGEQVEGAEYSAALRSALLRIKKFDPYFLIVAIGFDTARGDPTGTWNLGASDFEDNGRQIGRLHRPTLVVQEGGYDNRNLGANARRFFTALWNGFFGTGS